MSDYTASLDIIRLDDGSFMEVELAKKLVDILLNENVNTCCVVSNKAYSTKIRDLVSSACADRRAIVSVSQSSIHRLKSPYNRKDHNERSTLTFKIIDPRKRMDYVGVSRDTNYEYMVFCRVHEYGDDKAYSFIEHALDDRQDVIVTCFSRRCDGLNDLKANPVHDDDDDEEEGEEEEKVVIVKKTKKKAKKKTKKKNQE